jgi:hypothetical protein
VFLLVLFCAGFSGVFFPWPLSLWAGIALVATGAGALFGGLKEREPSPRFRNADDAFAAFDSAVKRDKLK